MSQIADNTADTTGVPTIEKMPISDIPVDRGIQVRESLDQALVSDYAAAMAAGTVFPPLIAFRDEAGSLTLTDGFHRLEAARQAALSEIAVEIRQGDRRSALLHALGANSAHGQRLNHQDLRNAVKILLRDPEWKKWSSRQIGKACGASHTFVDRLRAPKPHEPRIRGKRTRKVRRGGTEYEMKTSGIGSRSKGKQPAPGASTGSPAATTANDLQVFAQVVSEVLRNIDRPLAANCKHSIHTRLRTDHADLFERHRELIDRWFFVAQAPPCSL